MVALNYHKTSPIHRGGKWGHCLRSSYCTGAAGAVSVVVVVGSTGAEEFELLHHQYPPTSTMMMTTIHAIALPLIIVRVNF